MFKRMDSVGELIHVRVTDALNNYSEPRGRPVVSMDGEAARYLELSQGDPVYVGRPGDDAYFEAETFLGMPFRGGEGDLHPARVEKRLLEALEMPTSSEALEAGHLLEARPASIDVPVVVNLV